VNHPDLAKAKYVSFTTFRKNGTPVSTPVWFAPLDPTCDQWAFMSNDNVGKTKRLAHTSRVTVQECDLRGRVKEGAPIVEGSAVVVRDEASQQRVRAAVTAKYGLMARGFEVASLVGKVIPALKPSPRAGIIVTLP
jgi:PPOX class probable F420-dependent enzyme